MLALLFAIRDVLYDLSPWLLLGALIAGLLHVLLPANFSQKHLTGSMGVLRAVAFGVPLPLCSCSVIPVALGLKSNGASKGAVASFLISTPQTGIDSILVSASFLGWPFALFKVISAAMMGLICGWTTDAFAKKTVQLPIISKLDQPTNRGWKELLTHALEMLHSIWKWLVFGTIASGMIETFLPENSFGNFTTDAGLPAMLLMLVISVPLYVCATASVPIAAALVGAGMPAGTALVFLIAGPATNLATMGAIYKALGKTTFVIYLAVVILGSIGCGLAFDNLIIAQDIENVHQHTSANWWNAVCATILVLILIQFAWRDTKLFLQNRNTETCH